MNKKPLYKQEKKREEVTSEIFSLHNEDNEWVAQVMISSNKMIAIVSQYRNHVALFREIILNFKDFLKLVSAERFSTLLYKELRPGRYSPKLHKLCDDIAQEILPLLQKQIK